QIVAVAADNSVVAGTSVDDQVCQRRDAASGPDQVVAAAAVDDEVLNVDRIDHHGRAGLIDTDCGAVVEHAHKRAAGCDVEGQGVAAADPIYHEPVVCALSAGDGDLLGQALDHSGTARGRNADVVVTRGAVDGNGVRRAIARAAADR